MTNPLPSAAGRAGGPVRVMIGGEPRLVNITQEGTISAISPDVERRVEGVSWTASFTDIHAHGGGGFSRPSSVKASASAG